MGDAHLDELKQINATLSRIATYFTNLNIKQARIVENTDNMAHNLRGAIKQGRSIGPDIPFNASGLAQRLSEYTGFSVAEIEREIYSYWGIKTREDDY